MLDDAYRSQLGLEQGLRLRFGGFKRLGPEHEGSRPMDKLDLVFLPVVYVL